MQEAWVEAVSERDIQDYIRERFEKLGFSSIRGPFPNGPSFECEVDGMSVFAEVEKRSKDYLAHGHHRDPAYDVVSVLFVLDRTVPRGVSRSLLPPRIIAIDQEDFGSWLAHRKDVEERRNELLKRQFEGIEVRLEQNGRVLLSASASDLEAILDNIDCQKLAEYYSLVTNERRLMVMKQLLEKRRLRFSEILQITGNPKLVLDCVNPLIMRGMLVHDPDRSYRITAKGEVISNYLLSTIPLFRRFLEELERTALAEFGEDSLE